MLSAESNTGTQTVNAQGMKSYGVDEELTAAVATGLNLTASVSYDHAYYKEEPSFAGFSPAAVGNVNTPVNITGNQAIRAPKWIANLSADYTYPLPMGGTMNLHGSYQFDDGYPWDPQGLYRQPSYSMLIAQVGYATPDKRSRIYLWGNNLTNAHYESANLTTVFGTFATDAPPRTYGLSASWSLR